MFNQFDKLPDSLVDVSDMVLKGQLEEEMD